MVLAPVPLLADHNNAATCRYVFFIAIIMGLGAGLVTARRLDMAFFPNATSVVASGAPCCDGYEHTVIKSDTAVKNATVV
jgi:hypothetical protein